MSQTHTAEKPSQSGAPPRIISLKPIDQRHPVGDTRTQVFFVLPHHVDEELLRSSLDNLIRHHLPVLGSRINITANKDKAHPKLWEYQVPETFADDAVLFGWTSHTVKSPLSATKLIPDVTNSKGATTWGVPVSSIAERWSGKDWPRDRTDDKPDTPLLLVHFTKYEDSTILGINIPHAVVDQKGLASMLESWLAIAAGREPPKFLDLATNALDGPKDLPEAELRKPGAYRVKSKGEHIRSIMSLMPDLLLNRKEEQRMLFLSAAVITELRDRFNKELRSNNEAEQPILTNGDIVSSVIAKLAFLHRKKPVYLILGETVNARGRHPALPDGQHYLHNCPAYATAVIKFSRDTKLIDIARKHRLSVMETVSPEAIDRSFAVTTAVFHGAYALPVNGPGQTSFHVTNWSSAWHNTDFSPVAIPIPSGGDGESTATKAPFLVFGRSTLQKNKIHRLHAPVMCKARGGYWVDFGCSAKTMALVDELLARDPMLKTL